MGLFANAQTSRSEIQARKRSAPKVQVEMYKSDKDARKGIEKMIKKGWTVQAQASRGRKFSMHHGATLLMPIGGLLTSKQHHTVTFVREGR